MPEIRRGIRIKTVSCKGLGPAVSRNKGAEKAAGKYLFFCDSHVAPISANWFERMINFLKEHKKSIIVPVVVDSSDHLRKGYGMRFFSDFRVEWLTKKQHAPYHVPMACACFLAVRRKDFFDVGGFNPLFRHWGAEDMEFSLKSWLRGYEIYVEPSVEIEHFFKTQREYELVWKNIDYNNLLVAMLYFTPEQIQRTVLSIQAQRDIKDIFDMMLDKKIIGKRVENLKKFKYDMKWYAEKFDLDFG